MKLRFVFVLLIFSVCFVQAQTTTNEQQKKIAIIKTTANEKINKILIEKNNKVLEFNKEILKQRKEYEKAMYKKLDVYANKNSAEFQETYKYEIDKRSRFLRNLDIELNLLINSFDNRIEIIELERALNIEKYLNL